ncbi:hypothetical protein SBY92_003302 [Candida maltosa Xu316]
MYSISNLPAIPPPPSPRKQQKKKTKKERIEKEEEVDLGPENPAIPIDQSNNHVVNSWSKKTLYKFLFHEKIYPDVDEDLELIRKQVIEIYDFKKANGTLDEKYI